MGKYVLTWESRLGASAEENEATAKRTLQVFSNWTPDDRIDIHEFLARADGQGGYMVVSTDDLAALAGEIAKFAPFNYNTLHPVLEIADGAAMGVAAIEFRDGVS